MIRARICLQRTAKCVCDLRKFLRRYIVSCCRLKAGVSHRACSWWIGLLQILAWSTSCIMNSTAISNGIFFFLMKHWQIVNWDVECISFQNCIHAADIEIGSKSTRLINKENYSAKTTPLDTYSYRMRFAKKRYFSPICVKNRSDSWQVLAAFPDVLCNVTERSSKNKWIKINLMDVALYGKAL